MPYTVGVLMTKPYQILDAVGAIEILGMADKFWYESGGITAPPEATDIKILYISDTLDPVDLTANAELKPTTTFSTCPPLDLLLIPGPPVTYIPPRDLAEFLVRRAEETPLVMTTCIGSMVLAAVGLLDGKRATINKQVIDIVEKRFPETEWVRDERWVVDGKFWTGGGAITGIDMMYALMKSDRFQLGGLPEAAAAFLEYTPRPQKYT